jgi:hypothetical protein
VSKQWRNSCYCYWQHGLHVPWRLLQRFNLHNYECLVFWSVNQGLSFECSCMGHRWCWSQTALNSANYPRNWMHFHSTGHIQKSNNENYQWHWFIRIEWNLKRWGRRTRWKYSFRGYANRCRNSKQSGISSFWWK